MIDLPTKPTLFKSMWQSLVDGLTEQTVYSDNVNYQRLPDGDAEKHPKQLDFIHNAAHYAALVGGIGSGKSQGGAIRAIRAAYGFIDGLTITVPNLGMVTAPTYPMLRDSSLRTFEEIAGDLVAEYRKAEGIAVMKNGSEVIFRSTEKPKRLRGPNLSWWWGDEAAFYEAEAWRVMIGRLRQHGKQGYAWITTTPAGRNWVYQIFAASNENNPDYYIRKVKTRDNGFASEEWIVSMEASYEGDYAKQELEGEFVSFEGLIYPEFDRKRHVVHSADIPATFPRVIAGVDWGYVNPGVINVYGVTSDGRIYQLHEEYARQRGIDEWADVALQLRSIYRIGQFVCDPSEPDYIRKFNEKGCKAIQANNTVSTGIQAVKRRLAVRADGQPGLMYYPGAVHNFAEKEQYQWAKRRDVNLDEPLKANDHTQDAERYAIMAVDPVLKPVTATVKAWA